MIPLILSQALEDALLKSCCSVKLLHDQIRTHCSLGRALSNLSRKMPIAALVKFLTAIADSLKAGNRVEIRGFGSFALNYRPARTARNPKTGERVAVSGKFVPHFKAGKRLRELVDRR